MVSERTVYTRLKADISDFQRGMLAASASTKAFTKELNTSTDRSTMLTQSLLAIGPALVPITAAAIPAISGLTNQMAFAAAGVGVAALAFQGFGDALKATNDYAIEPTDANLQKMRQSLSELGPAGREFVTFLQEIRPELQGLQDAAQAGLFPGAQAGIDDLMARLPQVERIIGVIAQAGGDMLAEAGGNVASPEWDEFFTFLESEARPALVDFSRSLGNLAEGFANLWMAFDPLSDSFSAGFLQMSRDFAAWTDGLSETEGFQEFLDYIERTGPKVWDTLGALGNALLQVVEAAAPVGEVALPVIEAIADVLALVANSPAGPVLIGAAAGISALSRAVSLYSVANGAALTGMMEKLGGKGAVLRSAAAGVGVLALSMTDLDDKMGVANTATLGLMGLTAGPLGAALGLAAGFAMDFAAGNDAMVESMDEASDAVMRNIGSLEEQAAAIQKAREAAEAGPTGVAGLFGDAPGQAMINKIAFQALQDQYDENARAAQDLRFEEAGLGDAMGSTGDFARSQVDSLLALVDARNKLTEQALIARDAERAYEAAIDDAAEAVKKNGRETDIGTEKGRANEAALDQIANTWSKLDSAAREAAGGVAGGRKSMYDAAIAMGYGEDKARALANELIKIPTDVSPRISVPGATGALGVLQAIRAQMATLALMAPVNMIVNTIRREREERAMGGAIMRALGGSVVGPGTGTSDDIPALLSNGEHVLTAAEVQKAGGQGAIYRMRSAIMSGTMPAFAGGGAVSRYDDFSALDRSSQLDLERQKQRINELQKSLDEQESYGKPKKRRNALRGQARVVAQLELKEAKAELARMRSDNAKLKNYGTDDQEEAARDAVEEAERVVKEAADRFTTAKTAATDRFSIGSASSAAQVDRNLDRLLRDSQTFLGLLGDLKGKGASPWLLGELVKAGPTRGAIRLATQYNTDQAAFDSIQARASQIDQYTNAYAGLVGNSMFSAQPAWASGVSSASQGAALPPIQINIQPSRGMSEAELANAIGGQLAWRMTR